MSFIYEVFGYPLGWIMWLCYKIVPYYAVALLLFTVLSKIVMFPLGIKQHLASIKQAYITPKMNKLKEKYPRPEDREKLAQEQQRLYREEGVSMFGGCSSMLIQLPIMFGLIDVVYKPLTHILRLSADVIAQATEIAKSVLGTAFSQGTPQLSIVKAMASAPDQFQALPADALAAIGSLNLNLFGIDLTAIPSLAFNILLIVPLLAGLTTVLQTYLMTKLSPIYSPEAGKVPGGKGMLYGSAAMFVFFTFQMPAGVGFYYIFSNVLMIAQQFILNRLYNPKVELQKLHDAAKIRREKIKEKPVKVKERDGSVVEQNLTEKDLNRLRLERARQMDAEKYGE